MSDTVAGLVEQVRQGSPEAFEALVSRFQDLAYGTAVARLRDPELARDVAQEAFTAAFVNLAQLREPAAFPGWFRRIVWKHCDRVLRQRRPETKLAGSEDDPALATEPEPVERAEASVWMREAIAALPESERTAVALHYLAEESQVDVASFLEVPLSTIKKRLFNARRHLKERILVMLKLGFDAHRPSREADFSDTIRFFLAVRAGDLETIRGLLDLRPELVNAEEVWEREAIGGHELPPATHATPLIRAAERGDLALVDLLLERGAPPDAVCGCAGGESALWAAVATHRSEIVARLLERGADPNRRAFAGHTALHVAAIRGFADLAGLLLEHGADPHRRGDSGRTPLDWARVKGHREVLAALNGAEGEEAPADAPPSESDVSLYETGVKALDLFVPLVPGAIVHFQGAAGLGRNVLVGELCHRHLARRRAAVLFGVWQLHDWEVAEVEPLVAELGLEGRVELLVCGPGASGPERRSLAARAVERAEALAAEGIEQLLLVFFEQLENAADVDAVLPRLRRVDLRAATVFRIAPYAEPPAAAPSLAPPIDARVCFDPHLARAGLFPAVDPLASGSRFLDARWVGSQHAALAKRARELLGDAARERGQRLRLYLAQPFHVTESFVGRPGEDVTRAALLAEVERLLQG